MKPEDRIKFALEFAEMDLERVFRRPESLASFRNEFYEFHYGRGGESFADRGGILAIPDSEFASWKLAEFLTLQKKCRRFVAECAHGSPPRMAIPEMTLTAKYGLIKLAHDEIAFPMIRGSAHDLFMIVLWHLIAGAAGEHIGRCPEPKCGNVFFRPTRRAVYCSKACSGRARVRRFRAGAAKPGRKPVGKSKGNYRRRGGKVGERRRRNDPHKKHENPRG